MPRKSVLNIPVTACLAILSGCGGGSSSGTANEVPPSVSSVAVSCASPFVVRLMATTCSAVVLGIGRFDPSVTWAADNGSIDSTGGFIAPDAAQTVTITATSVIDSTRIAQTTVTVVDARPTVDRVDDASGYQVHVLYVVPSDGTDHFYDLDGRIASSVERWNAWLEQETGGRRIRLDTVGGNLDVSFVRLGRTHATMNAFGGGLRAQLEFELAAKGFADPEKLYVAYYDGGDSQTPACGIGSWPPTLPGTVAAMFMTAVPNNFDCRSVFFADSIDEPGRRDHIGIHELLHALGFIPNCAPHQANGAHVSDDVHDQMYVGLDKSFPPTLDAGRDDYFEHDISGCPDLADSAFLEPLPVNAEPPPGWPYPLLSPVSCADEPSLHSTGEAISTAIQFINSTKDTVNIYSLDLNGDRQLVRQLSVNEGHAEQTAASNPFVVTSATNQCLAIYQSEESFGRAIVR